MDIAIVTGAETPLGLHLIQRLVRQGYRVHGIGNNFSKVTYADPQFFARPVDLTDLVAVSETMGKILAKEKSLDLLIHAIDVTPGAAFEKLPVGNLEAILKIGLLGPVMLTRLALPNLLRFRGQLINVIPANKSGAPASAVNALLEGGLREMNRALFDNARDAGLRVTNLVLRQNPEPDALTVKSSEQTHIDLEDVARALEHLLDPNFANVPAELVLHPRCSAHSDSVLPEVPVPLDPYGEVVLPPQAYCPPEQPKIPTQEKAQIDRTIPYSDDEMEEKIAAAIEDFDAHPERYERSERKPQRPQPQQRERSPRTDEEGGGEEGNQNKRRRGRRRGGRNRNRERDPNAKPQDGQPQKQDGQQKPQQSSASPKGQKPKQDSQNQPPQSKATPSSKSPEKAKRPARKARSQGDAQSQPKSDTKTGVKAPLAEAPKKTPTKKAAKKAAKKIATKKAAKKAVKKVAKKKAAKKVAKASTSSAQRKAE
ncbi:MAG: NAD(P)-dependent dehydrogenase (short-subunit alcohol dehydrogenase family) [Candidatus Azotimanducaceae bacterium]|jgi:NAD(P)-dependent dehydrogenase (short-subunit alcohol dehydrogenase family)